MPGEHAKLSASGASRWLMCTPSAVLETEFPNNTSEAAEEGTLAHSIGELLIRSCFGRVSEAAKNDCLKNHSKDRFYNPELLEYATDYAAYVVSEFEKSKLKTPDAILEVEARLDMTDYIPEGFGTGDAVIIADGTLRIIDLKYGKGVPVSCVENKQMMLYALGALKAYDFLYDIQRVEMTIYQPRLSNISTWGIDVENLRSWAEGFLKPRAELAFKGEGEFLPGAHCKFCRAKNECKALADENLKVFDQFAGKNPALLSDKEMATIIEKADDIASWAKAMGAYVLDQAVNNGKVWPGYKLVEGRSNRAFTDEEKVAEVLSLEGFKDEQIYKPKALYGITELEKVVGKKNFNPLLGEFITKPSGKPTLAPIADPRPEFNVSAKAFDSINDEELN